MFISNDKLYIQTNDVPNLKSKINRAIKLSKELSDTLETLKDYDIEFEISAKKEEI